MATDYSFGILTVSDTCFGNRNDDVSGRKVDEKIRTAFPSATIKFQDIVPDEFDQIVDKLNMWIDNGCDVILTTGGTGFSPRDVTPEATKAVIEREAPGIAYAIMHEGLSRTPLAALSRAVCGIKGRTLLVNFPGSPRAIDDYFDVVGRLIPHTVALLKGDDAKVSTDHNAARKLTRFPPPHYQPSKVVRDLASRNRTSPYPLIEVSIAFEIILNNVQPIVSWEAVPIGRSLHRVLAEDICSTEPAPPFDASIKDGYAVIAAGGKGRKLVRKAAAAGDAPIGESLREWEAVRISTGAPIPVGADAVVQIEDTILIKVTPDGYEEIEIKSDCDIVPGKDIRRAGTDIAPSTKILSKYERIYAAHIGVMATIGVSTVKVFKRPSIGIISTGNEIVAHNECPKPGQIRDSNRLTIINLLMQYNIESTDCGTARDDPNSLKAVFERAFSGHDVVITTGGVSMGEFDLVKQVLIDDFGATVHFGRVNMKPGKPTTFATLTFEGKLKTVFALPGNPVSASVTCVLFAVQTLRFLERADKWKFPTAMMQAPISNNDTRPDFVRANVKSVNNLLLALPNGHQISSRLNSMVGCNGLILVPPKTSLSKTNSAITYIIGDIFQDD